MARAKYIGETYLSLRYWNEYPIISEITDRDTWKVTGYVLDIWEWHTNIARIKDVIILWSMTYQEILNNNPTKMTKLNELISEEYFTKEKKQEIKKIALSLKKESKLLWVQYLWIKERIDTINEQLDDLDNWLEENNYEIIEEVLEKYKSLNFTINI